MDRALIDGVTLEYEDSGRGEPVVFIHGAFIAEAFRPLLSQRGLAYCPATGSSAITAAATSAAAEATSP